MEKQLNPVHALTVVERSAGFRIGRDAILPAASYDLWLDPGFRDLAATTEMLKPYDAGQMRCYAVSTRVNNVANDDRQCSEPIEVSPAIQAGLF